MYTVEQGRLGNQIIRNLAVSLLAEKHNLKVNYCSKDLIARLGINLFSGNNSHGDTRELNDNNYFSILNSDTVNYGLNSNSHYFQTKEISNFLYNYIHSDSIKSNIISHNPFNERYDKNNDLFIHIRLTDAVDWNPGANYYLNTIKKINFDNLYITSDDIHHEVIKKIVEMHPTANVFKYDEIKTMQFGSTCKHIILSHGSFSAVIGWLAFFSNIYYPEDGATIWYGDMFSINNWTKCPVK